MKKKMAAGSKKQPEQGKGIGNGTDSSGVAFKGENKSEGVRADLVKTAMKVREHKKVQIPLSKAAVAAKATKPMSDDEYTKKVNSKC